MSVTVTRETLAAMEAVMAAHPELSAFGCYGVFDARRKSPDQRAAELADERRQLLEPRALEQFEAARFWLSRFPKTKRASKGTSYGLKHVAERDIGYVSNGAFIAAAIAEGFKVYRDPADKFCPNVRLNIPTKAWGEPWRG